MVFGVCFAFFKEEVRGCLWIFTVHLECSLASVAAGAAHVALSVLASSMARGGLRLWRFILEFEFGQC